MGVCVTIRQPNPVEAGAGSLEDMGFGSLNSGSGQVFGSLTDPQGSMTNVISGVLGNVRSEEHTSELQSLMRSSYAVFCLKKKHYTTILYTNYTTTLN